MSILDEVTIYMDCVWKYFYAYFGGPACVSVFICKSDAVTDSCMKVHASFRLLNLYEKWSYLDFLVTINVHDCSYYSSDTSEYHGKIRREMKQELFYYDLASIKR